MNIAAPSSHNRHFEDLAGLQFHPGIEGEREPAAGGGLIALNRLAVGEHLHLAACIAVR